MRYILDTNIFLFYLKDEDTWDFIESTYDPFGSNNDAIVSVVTIGEIKAIAQKNKWGKRRIRIIEELFDDLLVVDVTYGALLDTYATLDAFSQGKLFQPDDAKFSAKNMGKNDLWIAATAVVAGAELLTSDKDFSHLDGRYLRVNLIENLDSSVNS